MMSAYGQERQYDTRVSFCLCRGALRSAQSEKSSVASRWRASQGWNMSV